MDVKVGLCQTDIKWEDKAYNLGRAKTFLREASLRGVDVVFFPEMSFTGFSMQVEYTGETDGESLLRVSELAKEHNVAVGFGWVKLCGKKGENHYTVVDAEGLPLSDYVKIHPFRMRGEDRHFIPGAELVTFPFCNHTVSTFVCYDLRFPEPFGAAAKTADVLVVAANWPDARKEHWNCLLRARAIENQSYVLGINRVGKDKGGLSYSGGSMAIDPFGNMIQMGADREELLVCELREDAGRYRERFPVRKDRRAEIYKRYL